MSFIWDIDSRTYKTSDGTSVPSSDMRGWVDSFTDNYAQSIHDLTQQLLDQEISTVEWQLAMADAIKSTHLAAAMAAYGGRDQMTVIEWGATGQKIRTQYEFLRNFALGIENEDIPLDDRLLARAEMYLRSGYSTYENSVRARESDVGMEEERRELSDGENCDDCIEAAEMDWQPIGTLPDIGDSQCLANCRCSFTYRGPDEGDSESSTDES